MRVKRQPFIVPVLEAGMQVQDQGVSTSVSGKTLLSSLCVVTGQNGERRSKGRRRPSHVFSFFVVFWGFFVCLFLASLDGLETHVFSLRA